MGEGGPWATPVRPRVIAMQCCATNAMGCAALSQTGS